MISGSIFKSFCENDIKTIVEFYLKSLGNAKCRDKNLIEIIETIWNESGLETSELDKIFSMQPEISSKNIEECDERFLLKYFVFLVFLKKYISCNSKHYALIKKILKGKRQLIETIEKNSKELFNSYEELYGEYINKSKFTIIKKDNIYRSGFIFSQQQIFSGVSNFEINKILFWLKFLFMEDMVIDDCENKIIKLIEMAVESLEASNDRHENIEPSKKFAISDNKLKKLTIIIFLEKFINIKEFERTRKVDDFLILNDIKNEYFEKILNEVVKQKSLTEDILVKIIDIDKIFIENIRNYDREEKNARIMVESKYKLLKKLIINNKKADFREGSDSSEDAISLEIFNEIGKELHIFVDGFLTQSCPDKFMDWIKGLGDSNISGTYAGYRWPSADSVLELKWNKALLESSNSGNTLASHINIIMAFNKRVNISLYGHSLGARLIYNTLQALYDSDNYVKNVYLFGGAVSRNHIERWIKATKAVNGKIYNFYNQNDETLRKYYVLSTLLDSEPIGLFPIKNIGIFKHDLEKIINIDTTAFVEGHTDYKEKLPRLLKIIS